MPQELIERLWTRGREFLGVRYPILGGAMSWISESGLVSAICNAGAFGVLAGGTCLRRHWSGKSGSPGRRPTNPSGST